MIINVLSVNSKISIYGSYVLLIRDILSGGAYQFGVSATDNPQPSAGYGEGVVLAISRNGDIYKLIIHGDGHISTVCPYGTKTY